MKENEAIEIIKKDACNNRCIPQLCNDGCMYGNTKCAFSMAIKALEEVQQYRETGTVEECRKAVDVRKRVQEIVNRQLIAGKNNYREVYDCFQEIVKVVQENY